MKFPVPVPVQLAGGVLPHVTGYSGTDFMIYTVSNITRVQNAILAGQYSNSLKESNKYGEVGAQGSKV